MSEKNNELELYIAEGLKAIDPNARPTRGSGCGVEVGDVSNKFFYVEAKQKHTKENIIIDFKRIVLLTEIILIFRMTLISIGSVSFLCNSC